MTLWEGMLVTIEKEFSQLNRENFLDDVIFLNTGDILIIQQLCSTQKQSLEQSELLIS